MGKCPLCDFPAFDLWRHIVEAHLAVPAVPRHEHGGVHDYFMCWCGQFGCAAHYTDWIRDHIESKHGDILTYMAERALGGMSDG